MVKKIVKRFHKDIFFPEWSTTRYGEFLDKLRTNLPLSFSVHAVGKILDYRDEYGNRVWKSILNIIRNSQIYSGELFEFYWDGERIYKVCLRFPCENLPFDVVMVISLNATIITLYITRTEDTHKSMNKNLYSRKD